MDASVPLWAQSPLLNKLPVKSAIWSKFCALGMDTTPTSFSNLVRDVLGAEQTPGDAIHPASFANTRRILYSFATSLQQRLESVGDYRDVYGLGSTIQLDTSDGAGTHLRTHLVLMMLIMLALCPDLTAPMLPVELAGLDARSGKAEELYHEVLEDSNIELEFLSGYAVCI